jgi:hypothetical protein
MLNQIPEIFAQSRNIVPVFRLVRLAVAAQVGYDKEIVCGECGYVS